MSKLLFLILLPVLFFSCATNNVTVDDSLGKYFDSAGVKGSFALLDNGQGHFTIYNLPRYRDSLYPAAGTFDILLELVAFQTGVLKDEQAIGAMRARVLTDAEVSRRLADSIGIDTLKKWVDSLKYGNKSIRADSGHVLIGGIRINSDQQLGLIKKLYFNQLPFFRRPQELVKSVMTQEANSNYKLVYETGGTARLPGPAIGWVMGWVEENGHPYFFVTNVEAPDGRTDIQNVGIEITKRILPTLGFFQGKK